ncbi:MAG: excisionase family DNA-binding protein [Acidimicrobiales bacterium]
MNQSEQIPRALISVSEAARVIGVSRSYAYELVASGLLTSVRLGRRVLIPISAIDDLIAQSRVDF